MSRAGGPRRTGWALAALVSAAALTGCPHRRPAPPGSHQPGQPAAPPLELTLAALDGGQLALSELRGKIVVIHVFTTWSLAAQAEVDALGAADLAEDVTVIGLALDREGYPLVAPWRSGSEVRYLVTLADDAIRDGTSPLGKLATVPTTIVLDVTGRVHDRIERALAPGELAEVIDRVRAARAPDR